ncbi:enoyl-CoA hydratase [Emiliania huxleyi CCMP1516]|uniref:Probable enoyl-CoA hydratase, mitochondrial n=2 Tax=Emiliania huxleyi TaxID=2903 RepID=A0A0D3J601_EMIH1|nr:enoyl-CoA hydratase [Emiliania huxleyi CCMP1516]EOD18936.1 enoyl-CoA hydratase [Emiliania huxleyi CCMP1516]|eukprot:XP_005771365.1 enoyl-CoA hydratase [Emiliania huxleyi CCMP1516]
MFSSRPAASSLGRPAALVAQRRLSTSPLTCILEERRGPVGLITLNRPKALNALSPTLVRELVQEVKRFDADPEIGAIVVTGSGDKAFAAGADIKAMQPLSYMDMHKARLFGELDELSSVRTPIIAAVNGFALGGGCELAMTCDFILAADTAKFGQPEIKLGTIPGLGGTQRFTRAVGKSRAMELVLTGDQMSAEEARERGLVARVVPAADLLDDALKTAGKIAAQSQPIVAMAKTCVNVAFETSLAEGLRFERAIFYSTFATHDQKAGMAAFAAKEKPNFKNE